jgi:hypothetical protein
VLSGSAAGRGIASSVAETASGCAIVGRIALLIDVATTGPGRRGAETLIAAVLGAGIVTQAILDLAGADVLYAGVVIGIERFGAAEVEIGAVAVYAAASV